MISKIYSKEFSLGLERLGFNTEVGDYLIFISDLNNYITSPSIWFSVERAKNLGATAVFFRKTLGENTLPQVYIYDFTHEPFQKRKLTDIHKEIWTSGEVPIVCAFYKTDVKILECAAPIDAVKDEPTYLVESLSLIGKVHNIFNQNFASGIKSGVFWNEEAFINRFDFKKSAHDKLIIYLRKVINDFISKSNISEYTAQKLIIQSILVKYLEERIDDEGNGVFPKNYFLKYKNALSFCDVLRNGDCLSLFADLHNNQFNGEIFEWYPHENLELSRCDLKELANALDGKSDSNGQLSLEFWRQYAFNYIPVELISRLYEEFLGYNKKGLVYTPPHLARLLVDESMPLDAPVDLNSYKIIDPACGSGIFLVIAFKRLVQWWRLNNNMAMPPLNELKALLNSVYGIDVEEKATQLTAFSLCLALCDELTPKQIWDDLKFDDLTSKNIFSQSFFAWKKNNLLKFSLVIGNPPFIRGGISKEESLSSKMGDKQVTIPFKQISIKFFIESLDILSENGLLCMIGNASSLLYNPSSYLFKQLLFSLYNVIQIFDFTHLARNKTLWDNKEPATVALFINKKIAQSKNILHVTFRRTKATKSRILFDTDEYDLHFVNRNTAINNHHVWKNNLLGGGRIRQTIEKTKHRFTLEEILQKNSSEFNLVWGEGIGGGIAPPIGFFDENPSVNLFNIELSHQSYHNAYNGFPDKKIFNAPLLLIGENIGISNNKIPTRIINKNFKYYNEIVGIHSSSIEFLKKVQLLISKNMNFYRFHIICTSGKLLIYKNTSFKKDDLMILPFDLEEDINDDLSIIDKNVIDDVNIYMQDFMRHGESSLVLKEIRRDDYKTLINFGEEFCRAINIVYSHQHKLFSLCEIIKFNDNKFIAVIFSFDENNFPNIKKSTLDYSDKNFEALINCKFSDSINVNRIIRIYRKNKIIFVKPNQLKYWLPLFAYRDADKTFSDLSKLGY
ncbi:Eco57I restriction-modification methylase domain-containing protein [Mucilaginibacter sp.]